MTEALVSRLRAAVGAANVLTEGDLGAWEQDWRKRTRGKALAVLPPCGTMGVPASAQARTTAATSSVEPGRTTARALPRVRLRQSCSQAPRSPSVSTLAAPTALRRRERRASVIGRSAAGCARAARRR